MARDNGTGGEGVGMTSTDDLGAKKAKLSQLVASGHCAVLIQEMQRGVVGPHSGLAALAKAAAEVDLVAHVARVAKAARRAGVLVVHCTAENLPGHFGRNQNARLFGAAERAGLENIPGSPSVRPIMELGPESTDIVLPRYHGLSPMSETSLDQLLRNSGIATVVVVGVSLNIAIPNLVFDAVNRSYQVVVVSDAVAGTPIEYSHQVIANSLALVATLITTEEIEKVWAHE
jgi:nicotinamidase-related amidase